MKEVIGTGRSPFGGVELLGFDEQVELENIFIFGGWGAAQEYQNRKKREEVFHFGISRGYSLEI